MEQVPIILRELLYRLNDEDKEVLKATNAAFAALSKHVEAEELVKHIEFMRNLLNSMVSDARRRKGGVGDGEFLLPGFNMPKGTSEEVKRLESKVRRPTLDAPTLHGAVLFSISLADCPSFLECT